MSNENTNTELTNEHNATNLLAEAHETETHSEEAQNPIEAVAGQFGLNGQIFAAQLINFTIVMVVLWLFVYKPIMKILEERSEKIEKSVKQADEIEARVSEIEKERETVIVEARRESQEILEKAKNDSELRGIEMIDSAKREVERVIVKGKKQLADEKGEMLKELKKDIVDIAMKAAARIINDEIDEKKSKSLAEEVVRKMS